MIALNFAAWIADLGCFALQVKASRYLIDDGEWRLRTRDGSKPVFPDMAADAAIEQLAKRKGVCVVWGRANLLWGL